MIHETCQEIDELKLRHECEREQRYARRNRIHLIDELLNEFELLNLAEEPVIPSDLRSKVATLVSQEDHPLAGRPPTEVRIVEWMDALYDVQDTLMLTVEEDPEQ